jgi:hypothetical protein
VKIQSFQNVGHIPNSGWLLAEDGCLPGNTSKASKNDSRKIAGKIIWEEKKI